MKSSFFVITLVLVTLPFLQAACPNRCSGHGSCGASDVCACQSNWQGGDCSERICPYVRAWVDTAENNDDAHYYAECGNRGSCDRTNGQCVCDEGYTGSGCRRMTCPSSCSGHGTCEFIEEMASDTDKRIGGSSSVTYSSWDQEKIMGCKCDPGFEGHNCARRMCPKGDDPLTVTGQSDMKQIIQLDSGAATDEFFLTYHDPYGESWTTMKIKADGNICTNVQLALRRLPNRALDTVSVVSGSTGFYSFTRDAGANVNTEGTGTAALSSSVSNEKVCIVTFPSTPGTTGQQHLLECTITGHSDAGTQPMLSSTDLPTSCIVTEGGVQSGVTVHKLTELSTCSNRGVCNSETGACACFSGHKGLACEKQEALV